MIYSTIMVEKKEKAADIRSKIPPKVSSGVPAGSPSEVPSEIPSEKTEPSAVEEEKPSLADDFELLEKINILKAVMIRMKGGKHPLPEVNAMLKRRMNFSGEDFQGPYIVRLLSTLMMIFVFSALFWACLWILASGFDLSYFLKILSTSMATMVFALAGVAIFHPTSLPDEGLLKQAIEKKFKELHAELEEINGPGEDSANDVESGLADTTYEAKAKSEDKKDSDSSASEILSPMPEGIKEQIIDDSGIERPLHDDVDLKEELKESPGIPETAAEPTADTAADIADKPAAESAVDTAADKAVPN